jgi:hypothetical protein
MMCALADREGLDTSLTIFGRKKTRAWRVSSCCIDNKIKVRAAAYPTASSPGREGVSRGLRRSVDLPRRMRRSDSHPSVRLLVTSKGTFPR